MLKMIRVSVLIMALAFLTAGCGSKDDEFVPENPPKVPVSKGRGGSPSDFLPSADGGMESGEDETPSN